MSEPLNTALEFYQFSQLVSVNGYSITNSPTRFLAENNMLPNEEAEPDAETFEQLEKAKEWIDYLGAEEEPEYFIMEKLIPHDGPRRRRISPLDLHKNAKLARGQVDPEPLFVQFAGLYGKKPNAFCEFANTFGLLGEGHSIVNYLVEPISTWNDALDEFMPAFRIWKGLNTIMSNEKSIKEVMSQLSDVVDLLLLSLSPVSNNGYIVRDWTMNGFKEVDRNDHISVLKLILMSYINRKIIDYPCYPHLVFDDNLNVIQKIMPSNLLAAIWLQLSMTVTGEKRFKICEVCHKVMDVSDRSRPDKVKGHPNCINIRTTKKYRGEW